MKAGIAAAVALIGTLLSSGAIESDGNRLLLACKAGIKSGNGWRDLNR
jgi:hypothetical protein